MKAILFGAIVAGFFAGIGATRTTESTANAATVGARARCIINCNVQHSRCHLPCNPDSCPCEDQYDACINRCEQIPE